MTKEEAKRKISLLIDEITDSINTRNDEIELSPCIALLSAIAGVITVGADVELMNFIMPFMTDLNEKVLSHLSRNGN